MSAGPSSPVPGRGDGTRRQVVVTRAIDQAGELTEQLMAAGFGVIEVPVLKVVDPDDGGAALAAGVSAAVDGRYEWIVLTSVNGVKRFVAELADRHLPLAAQFAAVGPGTADVLAAYGHPPSLLPERFVAEGLLEVFPCPASEGRVLVPQAEAARPVLANGLRAKGWAVDVVTAYQTIPASLDPGTIAAARGADAITFTSSSTVVNFLGAAGPDAVPPVVVCIGPVTAATATERGLTVAKVAEEHSLAGLVAAVVAALGSDS